MQFSRSQKWTASRHVQRERAPKIGALAQETGQGGGGDPQNVPEFRDWCPLLKDGTPDWSKKGSSFKRWVSRLRTLGYQVESRELRACDYGAPTTRKRVFVIARCDGLPIVWPEPTHGPGRYFPYRTASECIDFSLPAESIFNRKKPLAETTMRRIARGIKKFVMDRETPFVIPLTHHGDARVHSIKQPFPTITSANRGELAVVQPRLEAVTEAALVAPTMVTMSYGERKGQAPRALDIQAPLGTVVSGGIKHAVVEAALVPDKDAGGDDGAEIVHHFFLKYYGVDCSQSTKEPLHTITTKDRFGLVTVKGTKYRIVDITLRMLTPRELYLAQGFDPSYKIEVKVPTKKGRDGKQGWRVLPKTAQVRMVGNSVCPPVAAALARAQMEAAPLQAAAA